jgi:hypothetical protein
MHCDSIVLTQSNIELIMQGITQWNSLHEIFLCIVYTLIGKFGVISIRNNDVMKESNVGHVFLHIVSYVRCGVKRHCLRPKTFLVCHRQWFSASTLFYTQTLDLLAAKTHPDLNESLPLGGPIGVFPGTVLIPLHVVMDLLESRTPNTRYS